MTDNNPQTNENVSSATEHTLDSHQLVIPPREEKEMVDSIEDVQNGSAPKNEKALALTGAIAVTGLFVVMLFFRGGIPAQPQVAVAEHVVTKIQESIVFPPKGVNPFEDVSLQARGAIVYDLRANKVIFGKNELEQLPLASLTKIMTSLLAVETLNDRKNTVVVTEESLVIEGDSGLFANESWDLHDLVSFTMLTSSNDGAEALAAAAGALLTDPSDNVSVLPKRDKTELFVEQMNTRAKELGLETTRYSNPTGLDDDRTGGVGSAKDTARLLAYVWENNPSVLKHTDKVSRDFTSLDNLLHTAKNTNEVVHLVPGFLGGKTGYTNLAGGNLAILYDAGLDHPVVIVVLGSTLDGRFSDVRRLVDATYAYVESGWYEYEMSEGDSL